MSLSARVREVIAATLKVPVERIGATTRYGDISQWDSLGQVNLVMALEQTFGVYIEADDFAGLNSVAAIVDYLAAHGVS